MTEFNPAMDAEFREYAAQNLRRHRLLSEANEDSANVCEAEDRMEELWPKLNGVQRRSLKGMASDLNWIRRDGQPPPKGRKTPSEVSESEQQELTDAMKSKEWRRILHSLRLCAPFFQPASLARERGMAYDAIGLPDYARVFNEFVVKLTSDRRGVPLKEAVRLVNCSRAMDARAVESARPNTVLVWEKGGVKTTAQPIDNRIPGLVDYQAA